VKAIFLEQSTKTIIVKKIIYPPIWWDT